jgi:hypothetical protein
MLMKALVMKVIAVAALTVALHTNCAAGPLGLEMGTRLRELQSKIKLKAESPHRFSTVTLPDGHPDFNDYHLVVTPQHGLCKLTAYTPLFRTSVYGEELTSKFDRHFNALTAKYGSTQRFDFLKSGSIWNDSKDWMMSLVKRERSLVAYWTDQELTLPDNLSVIKVEALGFSQESGMIVISYEFKNANDCINWIQSKRDSKL